MLKLIHTGDWHLGQVLYEHNRDEEQSNFLGQLAQIVADQQPDALLVSGDIFDNAAPSVAAHKLYIDGMLSIHEACPSMTIIVTAGNHDSASRLAVDHDLWKHFSLHVIGGMQPEADDYIVEFPGKGWVAAVPFIASRNLPQPPEGTSREDAFFGSLGNHLKEKNTQNLPTVLMAHLAVSGADFTSHKKSRINDLDIIGGQQVVKADCLHAGDLFDYVALGHIHNPMTLDDNGRVRYAGTPIAVSFDETRQHSVSLVTIDDQHNLNIQELPIRNPRPLLTIPEHEETEKEALKALEQLPADEPCYVRINVKTDSSFSTDLDAKAIEALKGKDAVYCTARRIFTNRPADAYQVPDVSPDEFRQMDPAEVVHRYQEQHGKPADEFDELLTEVLYELNQEDQQ